MLEKRNKKFMLVREEEQPILERIESHDLRSTSNTRHDMCHTPMEKISASPLRPACGGKAVLPRRGISWREGQKISPCYGCIYLATSAATNSRLLVYPPTQIYLRTRIDCYLLSLVCDTRRFAPGRPLRKEKSTPNYAKRTEV